jgi:hypothetical protein
MTSFDRLRPKLARHAASANSKLPIARNRIIVGQCVQCDDYDDRMTVEAISYGPFGSIAACIAFNDQGALVELRVPVRTLSLCDGESAYGRVTATGPARLRSGGPDLRVIAMNRGANRTICTWMTAEGLTRKRQFPIGALCGSS